VRVLATGSAAVDYTFDTAGHSRPSSTWAGQRKPIRSRPPAPRPPWVYEPGRHQLRPGAGQRGGDRCHARPRADHIRVGLDGFGEPDGTCGFARAAPQPLSANGPFGRRVRAGRACGLCWGFAGDRHAFHPHQPRHRPRQHHRSALRVRRLRLLGRQPVARAALEWRAAGTKALR
jgi:hypothetical protein